MSDLVGNPEDRFSRVAAQIRDSIDPLFTASFSQFTRSHSKQTTLKTGMVLCFCNCIMNRVMRKLDFCLCEKKKKTKKKKTKKKNKKKKKKKS